MLEEAKYETRGDLHPDAVEAGLALAVATAAALAVAATAAASAVAVTN